MVRVRPAPVSGSVGAGLGVTSTMMLPLWVSPPLETYSNVKPPPVPVLLGFVVIVKLQVFGVRDTYANIADQPMGSWQVMVWGPSDA